VGAQSDTHRSVSASPIQDPTQLDLLPRMKTDLKQARRHGVKLLIAFVLIVASNIAAQTVSSSSSSEQCQNWWVPSSVCLFAKWLNRSSPSPRFRICNCRLHSRSFKVSPAWIADLIPLPTRNGERCTFQGPHIHVKR
jgi:hypothetical protein